MVAEYLDIYRAMTTIENGPTLMIGYYIHHHGTGHRSRAQSICTHLDAPVTALTSLSSMGRTRSTPFLRYPATTQAGRLTIQPRTVCFIGRRTTMPG